jgi:hypothetical protein
MMVHHTPSNSYGTSYVQFLWHIIRPPLDDDPFRPHFLGSGWAFYLSEDGNDRSRCLLLDHIPAFPEGKACDVLDGLQCPPGKTVFDEDVWDQLYITLDIPDVACERCSIQMSNIMVDKSGGAHHTLCSLLSLSFSLSLSLSLPPPSFFPATFPSHNGSALSLSVKHYSLLPCTSLFALK